MRIAAISDIHSNIYALEAVVEDIESRNVDLTVCLGDLVGYMPFPNEVIGLIRQKNILTIMGNYDDGVGNMRFACGCDYKDEKAMEIGSASLVWTQDNISEKNAEYLKGLPKEVRMNFEDKSILFVHGSPRRLNEYLFKDSEQLKEVMEGMEDDVLVCGHIHVPYYEKMGDKLIVNTGSAGKPKHGNPNATYVILDIKEKIDIEIVEVPYEFEKTAKAIEGSELPNELAEVIRSGRG